MSEGPGEPSFADVLNGISGGGGKRRGERRGLFRRRRDEEPDGEPSSGVDRFAVADGPRANPPTPTGRHTGGFPAGSQEATPPWGLGRPERLGAGQGYDPADGHGAGTEDDDESDEGETSFVRPYAWTGGRTRPTYELAIETLISLGPQGRDPSRIGQYEHRAVADLCREPRSVAEVAALLKLPLGVARVLIGDMASQGTVVVHQTASTSEEGPDMALMERVLSGLRRL